jgi:hypothetical protein
MSTIDQTTNDVVEQAVMPADDEPVYEQTIALDLPMSEAEALRAWLLKPTKDGSSSLEEPLVSRVLSKLSQEVDAVTATVQVRRELEEAGLAVDHLTDEQMRALAHRVAEAARPGIRS